MVIDISVGLEYEANIYYIIRDSRYSNDYFYSDSGSKHGCPVDVYRSRSVDDHRDCDFSNQSLATPLISARYRTPVKNGRNDLARARHFLDNV